MQPLDKTLRNRLERTVKEAREVAEAGAEAALGEIGAHETSPYPHLGEAERDLRRRLRAHGRQLGDPGKPNGEQVVDRLIEKIAYEHWHRMLFARFLAENELLMYPDPDGPIAVSLEECEDLANDEGAANGWELAARFATRMLPQIFRLDSPVFELSLPPEHQQHLERLLTGLDPDVFTASDSLGWVYQFWQAKRKDQVNASEVKIGARELPAVTQLFTEPYMVAFLLDNSLGAWWAARRLTEDDLQNAASEEELREKAAIPGVPLEYLRFVRREDGAWTPAAGSFDGWPEELDDLKTLDPCCGSGHFLIAAFLMLVPMRMERNGFSAEEAVDAVLRQNLHGLELDQRCVELAAFALALTAWKYPGIDGYRVLPELNLACSGLSVSVAKEERKQLAQGRHNLRIAMDWLHDSFQDAPVLGSLLNPAKTEAAKLVRWDELSSTLEMALKREQYTEDSEAQQEVAVAAQGLAKSATLLAGHYHWVITNVPYLARGKQNERLRGYCKTHYSTAKNDLATVFLDRCLEFCADGGTSSVVLPQNWLFLTSYRKFREKLLQKDTWHLIARLGPGAFETISGEVVKATLISLSRGNESIGPGGLLRYAMDDNLIRGLDVSEPRTAAEKAEQLLTTEIKSVDQAKQLENPDSAIVLEVVSGEVKRLSDYAICMRGIVSGDPDKWVRKFWEQPKTEKLEYLQSSPPSTSIGLGKEHVIDWSTKGVGMLGPGTTNQAYGKKGVAHGQMRELPSTNYDGSLYDNNAATIVPINLGHLAAMWCYSSSPEFNIEVRKIDQKLNVTNATLVKVPFDLDHWTKIANEKYPNGLPKPYTDDPTQWIFHGHPCGSVVWGEDKKWTAHGSLRTDDNVLQVAVARLLGYRWPAEHDTDMKLADEQREWVDRCESLKSHVDGDGIVCIPPVGGEASASDRLQNLLADAYGKAWSNYTLAALLESANHSGRTLETWLREKFFAQHCRLFHHRPFIWHIWDGLRDGFAVLVSYHNLDAKLLEALIYTYLGDWIGRQKQDIANSVDGAQERLAAAESLKNKLELILEGEEPYDIFVRWKLLEKQPIGWDPDLNDGVRLNIRPFLTVPDVGKKGAGVLREKPNIKWNKDRGKDTESAPWYSLFKGDRINNHHLTLAEKRAAREQNDAG